MSGASGSGGKRKTDGDGGYYWDVGVTDPEHFLTRFGAKFKTSAGSKASTPDQG